MQDIINNTSAIIEIEAEEEIDLKFSKKNFRSIINNLLSNAIKYRHPDRKPIIKINLKNLPEWTLLSIEDNGLGVSEDQKNKMFSMFKRFHDHVEGTGIGLYIIKRIIDNAQGKIEVTSAKGIGTKFDIYFKKEHS